MIDFARLVEEAVLLDEVEATSTSTSSSAEVETLNQFFKSANVYKTLQPIFTKKYGTPFPFPSEVEFNNAASTAANSFSRYTKDADKYDEKFLMNAYPLLDLFAQLYQVLKGRAGGNVAEANKILKTFIQTIQKDIVPPIPLDYPAIIQWAKDVKADYFAANKQEIGQARLDSIQPRNLGIYATILHLLSIRRTSFKTKVDLNKIPPAQEFIKKIFFNPQVYINGTEVAPSDEKVALLYNEITVKNLIEIAQAAYQLFKQQLISIVNPKDGKIQDEQRAYAEFLGNGERIPAPTFDWNKYNQQQNNEIMAAESFDVLLKTAYNTHLAEQALEQTEFEFNDKRSQNSEQALRPFEKELNVFEYNLDSIKKFKQNVPQAETLYNKLLGLANFIKKEQETDLKGIVQGIGQAAKGLSLGVPSMGSR